MEYKTRLVSEKQRFFDWLCLATDGGQELTGSTFLDLYFERSTKDFFDYLKQRKKIKLTPKQAAEIKAQFERSVSIIKPLMACNERTNWLIDQIVYRLYGLTEEEIQVVEESIEK